MSKPRILILRAPGTNCDVETAFAFERAGGEAESLHLNQLLEAPQLAANHQILCIPGGFSFGDDVAAGRIFANQIRHHLADVMQEFRAAGKLVLGICNGFQVLIKSGLLDTDDESGPAASLSWNDSGRYVARWVQVGANNEKCVFLSGCDKLFLPIAHAEGKFVVRDEVAFQKLEQAGQLVLRYCPQAGSPDTGEPNTGEPDAGEPDTGEPDTGEPDTGEPDGGEPDSGEYLAYNPNGAVGDVAGMCDQTGRVFGLMPHPERFIDPTQHPQWTRLPEQKEGAGLQLFRNAVRYFS